MLGFELSQCDIADLIYLPVVFFEQIDFLIVGERREGDRISLVSMPLKMKLEETICVQSCNDFFYE